MRLIWVACALAVALAAPVAVRAIDLALGTEDLERAIKIGKASEAERARFHASYIVPMNVNLPDVTFEQIETITEFRRAELEAEDRLRFGDHMFSPRQAGDAIKAWKGKVTLAVRMRFHPHNVLVSVPAYEVVVGNPGREFGPVPLAVRRNPLYTFAPGGRQPAAPTSIYGAVVEVDFQAADIGQTTRLVRVRLDVNELARTTINFRQVD